ncbi:MAG: thiamine-phosphate kinase [Bacteroidetes bacterium]|jgi:thiamine-monophosphate kinase|nr:thiamine-phosphate kinase [Bacteroidota bacterium]MBT6686509.1 thiamine-phosphate kinase [Bacteroidota bacterium]MBT7144232.1 thiamine-phosphate kinase [Bacteroidota bacterium]MBT7491352.1 thiamine-phosphate kinase [Bacteroidota bacterium]
MTKISEIGEFKLIETLTEKVKLKNSSTIKGIGDDAAVLDYGYKQIVVTTDLLVEGIHFDLIYTPLKHLGYKAVVVNLSDIYAMNAIPKQITVSIAISNKFTVKATEEIYSGIYLACEIYGVDLIGGDTSSSVTGLTINVTALGEVSKEDVVYRNSAKKNDLILVSGDLGSAYFGLLLLEREKEVFKTNPDVQPKFEGYDYILERQLKPEARKDVIAELKKINVKPSSMIDISDGLSSELLHICKASNVGCKIYEEKIPIDASTQNIAEEFSMVASVGALSGGEDYELLFTASIKDFEKLKNNEHFEIIGHIADESEGKIIVTKDGSEVEIIAQGWDGIKE